MLNANHINGGPEADEMSSCDTAQQVLLDLDLDEPRRRQVAMSVTHVNHCAACRKSMKDCDRMRAALRDESAATPRAGWDAYFQRLQSGLTARARPRPVFWRWIRPMAAVAASLLFVVGGFVWGSLRERQIAHAPKSVEPTVAASFSASDIARQVRAFGEIDQVFEGHTRWLLLTGGGADVALDDTANSPGRGGKKGIMLLRLDLSRNGKVVSTADLVIVAGKTAEVHLPLMDGTSLRYRLATSALDPSRLGLRAELSSSGMTEPQASLATSLQLVPDRGIIAGPLIAPTGRYDVEILFARELNQGL